MRKYPGHVQAKLDRRSEALLKVHAERRGVTPGELARDLLTDAIALCDADESAPLWLELLVLEIFRLRAVVLKLFEVVGEQQGWSRDHIVGLIKSTREKADEHGRERIAEITEARRDAVRATRR
jgi:hypothetical protein